MIVSMLLSKHIRSFYFVYLFGLFIVVGHSLKASGEENVTINHAEPGAKPRPYAAGVAWIGGDDPDKRNDFEKESAERMQLIACGPNSVLNIPAEQYFELSKRNGENKHRNEEAFATFSKKVDSALATLKGKKHPELHLLLTVHGGDGVLCPSYYQRPLDREYAALFRDLIAKIETFKKDNPQIKEDPKIIFYLNVCESYSSLEALKQLLASPDGKYSNGKDSMKFKFPVDLIAGADRGVETYGHGLWDTMQAISDLNRSLGRNRGDTFFGPADWSRLCTFETNPTSLFEKHNEHRVWSSYHSVEQAEQPSTTFSAALEMLGSASNPALIEAAGRELFQAPLAEISAKRKEEVLAAVEKRLHSPGNVDIKSAVLRVVGKLGLSNGELQRRFLPLLNDSAPDVREAVLNSSILEALKGAELNEKILERLLDPSSRVAFQAAFFLRDSDVKELPKERVITVLHRLISRDDGNTYAQEKAIEWLIQLGDRDPGLADRLFQLIENPREHTGPAEASLKYLSTFYPNDPRLIPAIAKAGRRVMPYDGLILAALEAIPPGGGKSESIIDLIKENLTRKNSSVVYEALKALERMQNDIPFGRIENELRKASVNKEYYESVQQKAAKIIDRYKEPPGK